MSCQSYYNLCCWVVITRSWRSLFHRLISVKQLFTNSCLLRDIIVIIPLIAPLKFPAPLKLRPYGAIQICLLLLLFLSPPAQSRRQKKTRLDIQNYSCNGNLLCYHGVVERNRISSLQSHGKALLLLIESCQTRIFVKVCVKFNLL